MCKKCFVILFLSCILCFSFYIQAGEYLWHKNYKPENAVKYQVLLPENYDRIEVEESSFEYWLRHLPIRVRDNTVYLYNNKPKPNQNVHYKIIDIDTGNRDLQQCADAVIRLIAEYLFYKERYDDIAFNFTSGDRAFYKKWVKGYRPKVEGNNVSWHRTAGKNKSYENFKNYLTTVFIYAGSYSLQRELKPIGDTDNMQIGDIFIQGGFPGHAVIIIDIAENIETGSRIFLLAQSYMPAQDLHILKNLQDTHLSPWYSIDFQDKLITPEWTFNREDLMRFEM